MNKMALYKAFEAKYEELKKALAGDDLDRMKKLTLEVHAMVPEEWVMRILEVGGVTTDFRSVWLLVFWGRLTRGGMILTPMTYHHMMHLPACIDHLPMID